MTTNFFQNIQSLHSAGSWIFNISVLENGSMVVSVLLSGNTLDKTKKSLPPMVLRGTANEMDEGFFDSIASPVEQTKGLFLELDAYQKGIEQAKASITQKPKTLKSDPVAGKPSADSADDKKSYEQAIKQVMDLNALCKYSEALEILPPNSAFPEKQAELEKLRRELEWKKGQLSLL